MPTRVVTTDGLSYRFEEYRMPEIGPCDVRVRVEFAAPKHGTERQLILGSPLELKRFDPHLRMYFEREEPVQAGERPARGLGNMVVGTVTEVGPDVTRFSIGDRVFGYGPIQEEHQQGEGHWWPLGDLSESDAVCVDPAHVAFVAVRDGNVRVGDNVAVFGLGAIGLTAVQIARAAGAFKVFAVDPITVRRDCAVHFGADLALDPAAWDAALELKRATGDRGADVSIETSGNARALHESIRCLMQCGTVVHVPWGPGNCTDLRLNEEFHLNRISIIGSQAWAGWGNADRDFPRWTHERAFEAAIQLLRDGIITGEGIVAPIVSFADCPDALRMIFESPQETVKVGVRFE